MIQLLAKNKAVSDLIFDFRSINNIRISPYAQMTVIVAEKQSTNNKIF